MLYTLPIIRSHGNINRGEEMKKNNIVMINGPIVSSVILFAIPMLLSGILQILFNAAYTIVVGRFAGLTSMAAIGST